MGRPFAKELLQLQGTLDCIAKLNLRPVEEFLSKCYREPLYTVGVGGSFTAALLAAQLQNARGGFGEAKTTLEFTSNQSDLRKASVILFSGAGNNRDIIAAFDHAIAVEAKAILIVCASKRSRIVGRAAKYWETTVFDFELPSRRDGFLATNSLLANCSVIAKAFGEDLNGIAPPDLNFVSAINRWVQRINKEDRETLLVLYGGEVTPAAIDLESKCSEAAIANVIPSDYRHFAHGRHVWLAKRAAKSAVIAFAAPSQVEIARETLRLLPKTAPVLWLRSNYRDGKAAIDLLMKVFHLVGRIGEAAGIDPGRPGVPQFGRRIYRLQVQRKKGMRATTLALKRVAIQRKQAISPTPTDWNNSYDDFLSRLSKARFSAVVLDFDGTLCSSRDRLRGVSGVLKPHLLNLVRRGVTLGVATGRGKSAHVALREVFPKNLWANVVIGFYNGGCISSLAEDTPDLNLPPFPLLQLIYDQLTLQPHVHLYDMDLRPWQLSIKPRCPKDAGSVANLLNETVAKIGGGAELVYSSHSFDILAPEVSKLQVVAASRRKTGKVLCIGDRGAWPGNDFRLLSTEFGLSAESVSIEPTTCWNLAPPGVRCVQATCFYLAGLIGLSGFARYSIARSLNWFRDLNHE